MGAAEWVSRQDLQCSASPMPADGVWYACSTLRGRMVLLQEEQDDRVPVARHAVIPLTRAPRVFRCSSRHAADWEIAPGDQPREPMGSVTAGIPPVRGPTGLRVSGQPPRRSCAAIYAMDHLLPIRAISLARSSDKMPVGGRHGARTVEWAPWSARPGVGTVEWAPRSGTGEAPMPRGPR